MKRMNRRKILLAALAVAILLTLSVSGTVAWLSTKTPDVKNTFTPAAVDTEIDETFSDDSMTVKTNIYVKNVDDAADKNISAWVRVAVVGNWCNDDGKIVEPWNGLGDNYNTTNWTKAEDGFYYYNNKLEVGQQTENLLIGPIARTDDEHPNLHLEVIVLQQAIQAEGMGASSAQEAFAEAAKEEQK